VAWSLHYELLFYAVFGCFVAGRWPALLAVAAVVALAASCIGSCGFPQSFVASQYLLLFALGAGVAAAARWPALQRRAAAIAFAGALAFVTMALVEVAYFPGQKTAWTSLCYGAASALLILGLVGRERHGVVLGRARLLQHLGDSSYVLYLLHYPLVSVLCKLLVAAGLRGDGGAIAAFALTVCVCVAASSLFHLWIEKPLMKMLTPRFAARPPTAPIA